MISSFFPYLLTLSATLTFKTVLSSNSSQKISNVYVRRKSCSAELYEVNQIRNYLGTFDLVRGRLRVKRNM